MCDRQRDKSHGKEEGFLSVHDSGESRSLRHLVTSHLQSATEHREPKCSAAFSMLYSPRSTDQRMVLPTIKTSLSTSVNTLKRQTFLGAILNLDSPDRCAQRLVSWIILDSIKLTTPTVINKTYIE